MGREIKFRAWDKWEKRMIQPHNGDFIKWHSMSNWKDCLEVMQFTGLKDKNDMEIYEGDIVRNIDGIAIVKYDELIASFVMEHKEAVISFPHYFFSEPKQNKHTIEVVSNIYETPEFAL